MWYASNRRRRRARASAGVATMEFALVAIPFFFITFATIDLGRYFITRHMLHTLMGELARTTMAYCAATQASPNSTCALPATGPQSIQSAQARVPFLYSGSFVSSPTASRSAMNANTGTMVVTASASYSFNFFMPVWTNLSGTLSDSTQVSY